MNKGAVMGFFPYPLTDEQCKKLAADPYPIIAINWAMEIAERLENLDPFIGSPIMPPYGLKLREALMILAEYAGMGLRAKYPEDKT